MKATFQIPARLYRGCGRAVAFFKDSEIVKLNKEGDLPADLTEAALEAQIQLWVDEGGIEGMCSGGRFIPYT